MTKKYLLILIALLLGQFSIVHSGLANASTPPRTMDRIVAIVNDDIITQTQLNQQMRITKAQMKQNKTRLPNNKVLRKQLLQSMINDRLQLSLAEKMGIRITKAELHAAIMHIAKQNHVTLKELYQEMHKIGWTPAGFQQEILREMVIQKLQGREVASRISMTQLEIDNAYQIALKHASSVMEYHLKNIVISLPDTPTPKAIQTAKTKSQHIIDQLKKGADFQKIAMEKSNDASALKGGDLDWRNINELPVVFAKKVPQMKANEIAGPFQTPNGFHIIKLVGKRLPKHAKISKAMVKHLIFERKLHEGIDAFIQHLRGQAYVKIIEDRREASSRT